MAPVGARDVTQRDAGTGKTFSIVFAVIAFLVVAICIVWGYFIPKWRFKYGHPYSTRSNCIGRAAKLGPSTPQTARKYVPHFPSHPGVRGLHKSSSLLIYNPRTESPFGNSPRIIESVHLHGFTPTCAPATQRKLSPTRKRPTHDYELPKTPSTLSQLALTDSLRGFSHKEDDESERQRRMAAPAARPAGRAPPLTKQLALFPSPDSNQAKRFDTLARPNLLFEKLDKLDSPKVSAESGESCLSGSTSMPKMKRNGRRRMDTTMQTVQEAKSQIAEIGEGGGFGPFGRSAGKPSSTKEVFESTIAVPKPVHRHKSKMPVGDVRNRYDYYSGGARFMRPTKVSLQRRLTPSTELLTSSAFAESGFPALNTPPTSPSLPTHNPTLIPTPLRVRRAAAHAAAASPTPADTNEKHNSSSQSSMAVSPGKLAPFLLQKSIKSKRKIRKSTGFHHQRPNLGTIATKQKPIHIKRRSWKSSSMCSRDTKGVSIPPSPMIALGMDQGSKKSLPQDEPSPARANSMDLDRSKIDDWNLHAGDLALPIPPFFDTQSAVGSRGLRLVVGAENPVAVSTQPKEDTPTSFGLTMPIPRIYIGRPGDDVFGDRGSAQNSGRVLRRVLDMEMASSKSNRSRYYGKTAPGGAEWI